jgi:hypothetical protein
MSTTSLPPSVSRVDWRTVATEFTAREITTLRRAVALVPGLDVRALGELFDPDRDDADWRASALPALREAFAAATAAGAATLLAAYLYGQCQVRWEMSSDHPTIRRVAEAASEAFPGPPAPDDGADGDADDTADRRGARLVLDLARSLRSCMAVENALTCSCPVDAGRHATEAAAAGRAVGARCTPSAAEGHDFIAYAAGVQERYFSALHTVTQAVQAFIGDRHRSGPTLHAAIAAAAAAEDDAVLSGDVYQSELRSHRAMLEAMAGLTSVPSLRIDDGRLSYCYPFTVLGLSVDELREAVQRVPRGSRMGRATVVDVSDLDVNDTWNGSDPEGRRYSGIAVTFAPLAVATTAGVRLPPHRVEMRFTTIGTCYLRISTRLLDASEHELNQAMRRGSPHMGTETVGEGGSSWDRLGDYVDEVLAAFGARLQGEAAAGTGVRIVERSPRRHHTVLSVREMSIVDGTGARAVTRYDEVEDTLGARLFAQRVSYVPSTFEEYLRLPKVQSDAMIGDVGFEGEVLAHGADSTLIAMPTSPNFSVAYYEEMAEFTASLPALLDKWTITIFEQRRDLAAQLPKLDAAVWDEGRRDRTSSRDLARDLRRLERRQSTLQATVAEARSMLAFVKSPSLCLTTRLRRVLDVLLDATAMPLLENDLEAQIAQVDALHLHVQAVGKRLDDREQRRYRVMIEWILAVLAASSLVDFFSFVNGAFGEPGRPTVIAESAATVAVCVLASIAVLRLYQRYHDG